MLSGNEMGAAEPEVEVGERGDMGAVSGEQVDAVASN